MQRGGNLIRRGAALKFTAQWNPRLARGAGDRRERREGGSKTGYPPYRREGSGSGEMRRCCCCLLMLLPLLALSRG